MAMDVFQVYLGHYQWVIKKVGRAGEVRQGIKGLQGDGKA